VKITSSNTQRLVVNELGLICSYFVIAILLLLAKLIEQNKISILLIAGGFCITLVTLFIFGTSIVKLRQRQEDEGIKEESIIVILVLSFLPYVFGLYLISIIGIYNLFAQFSIFYFPQAAIYAYLGYLLIKKVKTLQELGIRISENK
jgi:hypothetical protein